MTVLLVLAGIALALFILYLALVLGVVAFAWLSVRRHERRMDAAMAPLRLHAWPERPSRRRR